MITLSLAVIAGPGLLVGSALTPLGDAMFVTASLIDGYVHRYYPGVRPSTAACYDYQACQNPEHDASQARRFVELMRQELLRKLSSIEQESWGIGSPEDALAATCRIRDAPQAGNQRRLRASFAVNLGRTQMKLVVLTLTTLIVIAGPALAGCPCP
ncbi:hypothetical protein [Bosea sp. R86505]|uniref:hypothetical protein n=1 Tax=Bosea sp. R86505 TaxID=3101710 RepID=UPI00366F0228